MGKKYYKPMPIHKPVVNDFGGAPIADHDVACPVCWINKAKLVLNTGVFQPCEECRIGGWEMRKRRFGKGKLGWSVR